MGYFEEEALKELDEAMYGPPESDSPLSLSQSREAYWRIASFFACVIFFVTALFVGGGWWFVPLICAVVVWIVVAMAGNKEARKAFVYAEVQKQREKEMAEFERIEEEERKKACEAALDKLKEKFGFPTTKCWLLSCTNLARYSLDKEVCVYEEARLVLLQCTLYKFSEILDCKMQENVETEAGDTYTMSETDMGSVVARSLAGGMLAGKAGAVIGGTTAKRKTYTIKDDDIVTRTYRVVVRVDNLSWPKLEYEFDENGRDEAEDLYNTLCVIIKRNSDAASK